MHDRPLLPLMDMAFKTADIGARATLLHISHVATRTLGDALQDMQRPLYMRPPDALAYNIIDEIIEPDQDKVRQLNANWCDSGTVQVFLNGAQALGDLGLCWMSRSNVSIVSMGSTYDTKNCMVPPRLATHTTSAPAPSPTLPCAGGPRRGVLGAQRARGE
jgi:hypothetical protein